MVINPDTCRDPVLLAREVRRLQATLDEIREVADQADVEYRAEIERLRLTDAERAAVDAAQNHIDGYDGKWGDEIAATLRGMLERLK